MECSLIIQWMNWCCLTFAATVLQTLMVQEKLVNRYTPDASRIVI